ncbi:minor tail protein [Clavibacter phage CN1A]|uniref:Uncharacterized protein n=1 Tax=Clavibacter phage CN1A TaxID=1406793 RepID=U5PTE2_9CAUD|nr:minor tail protein [Clavibacter phage CN1A]AGY47149.1 hypothetical protein CN1A_40 [Clavibacter phage CN1A]
MYFGTRERMLEIPNPVVGIDATKTGWSSESRFLGGGASARSSVGAAKSYSMSWKVNSKEDMRPLLDFADQIHGKPPFYFIDPMQGDANLLNAGWAAPFQGVYGGPLLLGNTAPTYRATPENDLMYPLESAVYNAQSGNPRRPRFHLPIPPGYAAWFGVHGVSGLGPTGVAPGLRIEIETFLKGRSVSKVQPAMMTVRDENRTNISFRGPRFDAIDIYLTGFGTVLLSGLILQLLPLGASPATGGFISGQGNSGVVFSGGQPQFEEYSSGLNRVNVSADFLEVGAWLGA